VVEKLADDLDVDAFMQTGGDRYSDHVECLAKSRCVASGEHSGWFGIRGGEGRVVGPVAAGGVDPSTAVLTVMPSISARTTARHLRGELGLRGSPRGSGVDAHGGEALA
jgi:hypothetical protein